MTNMLLTFEVMLGAVVVISVLMQKSKADALSGLVQGSKTDSFFAKNKSKTRESILAKVTSIAMLLFMINTVVLNLI